MAKNGDDFKWLFKRMGGLDQVEFRSGEDIRRVGELDPKLWVALSCPASGLEFDQRTLTLLDSDKDGRIRIPEVIEATKWLCERLKDPGVIMNQDVSMPLDVIDDSSDAGKRLLAAGEAILEQAGKPVSEGLSREDVHQAVLHASEQTFNGDGILPPLPEISEEARRFIEDAILVIGGIEDAGGGTGIDAGIADAFMDSLRRWREWRDSVEKAEAPLGKDTAECWRLLGELESKIDDYFMRCELIAYSPAARERLNLEDKPLTDETGLLEWKALAELPLSKAGSNKPLDLGAGLNPAWREKMERFAALAKPLLNNPGEMSREDWEEILRKLRPFGMAVGKRPEPAAPESVTVAATKSVEDLGEKRVEQLLDGKAHAEFLRLAEEDANGPAASSGFADIERLVLLYLHFHRLLTNFVNFEEFYDLKRGATFQSGSLFIDGRSCHLCMPAGDVEAHAELAKGSEMFLLYCECTRGRKPGGTEPEKTMNIVAAVTAGDSDLLTPNRNGVFVDNRGDDWDARVVKVVSNPIGVWQAVWSPYKRIGSLVTEQISKYASEKQAGLMDSAGKKIAQAGAGVAGGAAPKFDIGRNVGIFAAVGLALGAIGTAVGSIFNALLSMAWWQLPPLLFGLFVLISGPSVLLAWLKLRRRTLGPLLEASGWAINGRVALSYGLGGKLCRTAAMPPNSLRKDLDPAVQLQRLRRSAFWIAVVVGVFAVMGYLGYRVYREEKDSGRLAAVQAELEAAAKAVAEPPPAPAPEPASEPAPCMVNYPLLS